MHQIRQTWAVSVLLLALASGTASADPIVLITDLRGVSATVTVGSATQQNSAGPGDALGIGAEISPPAGHAAANATLISSFADLLHLAGEGSAAAISSGTTSAAAVGSSVLAFEFDVLAPLALSFTGTFQSSGDTVGRWQVLLERVLTSASSTIVMLHRDAGSAVVSDTALLQPGRYGFALSALAETSTAPGEVVSQGIGYTFGLDFADAAGTQTPEPATILLLALGVGLLLTRSVS